MLRTLLAPWRTLTTSSGSTAHVASASRRSEPRLPRSKTHGGVFTTTMAATTCTASKTAAPGRRTTTTTAVTARLRPSRGGSSLESASVVMVAVMAKSESEERLILPAVPCIAGMSIDEVDVDDADAVENGSLDGIGRKEKVDDDTGQAKTGKQALRPLAPKCWCRLPTEAKLACMRDTDPLHPGRAYWTCANVGCSCNFFQWVDDDALAATVDALPTAVGFPLRHSSFLSSSAASYRQLPDDVHSPFSLSSSVQDGRNDGLRTSSISEEEISDDRNAARKPYRVSMPIPIPVPAGRPRVAGRRRTPSKSAEDVNDC